METDFSTDMTVVPVVAGAPRNQRVLRLMQEFGHAQLGNGDEDLDVAEASGCGLRLLDQTAHCFNVLVAASVGLATHGATEVLVQGDSQLVEGFHPLHDLLAFGRPRSQTHEAQCLLLAPDPRTLQIRTLRPVRSLKPGMGPTNRVLAHAPPQPTQRLLALRAHDIGETGDGTALLLTTDLVHRPIGRRYRVEVLVGHVGTWPRLADPVCVGCAPVDAGAPDGQVIAAVSAHVLRKGLQVGAIAPRFGTQAVLSLRFMGHGDVFLPAPDADLVDPGFAHGLHSAPETPHPEVMAQPTPHAFRRGPHLIGCLAHRHFPTQRQAPLLELQGKATALTRHRLRCPAAAGVLHQRDLGRQRHFEPKDLPVTPVAPHTVVYLMRIGPTRKPRGPTTPGVLDPELDPPLACAEFHLGDVPSQLQLNACGENGLHLKFYAVRVRRSGAMPFNCGYLSEPASIIAPETYPSKAINAIFQKIFAC